MKKKTKTDEIEVPTTALVIKDIIAKYWGHVVVLIIALGIAMSGFVVSCPGKGKIIKKGIDIRSVTP